MKIAELRNLSDEELHEKLGKLKKDLMQFRFQSETGKLERQSAQREVRRDIARILTLLNENKIEEKK